MAVQFHDLEPFVSGDSLTIPIEFQRDGSLLDLTGWKVWFSMKHAAVQADDEAALQVELEVTGSDTEIYLSPEKTRELIAKQYDYDIQIVSPDKAIVTTLVIGKVDVIQGVTTGA